MYKTKIRLALLITFGILTLLLLLFAALLYVSSTTSNNIFNIALVDKDIGKVWAIIMFAVAGACAVLTICLFIFYLLAISHNKKTIEIIERLKVKYAETKHVPVENVEVALDELVEEIKECEKNGVEYKPPVAQPNQQNVVQVNNYNAQQPMMNPNQQYMMPQNNYYTAANPYYQQQMAPGAPRPPMAPGAMPPPPPGAPRPPMAPVNRPR